MKTALFKIILKDIIKKFIPLIINAVCASICVITTGCTLTAKDLNFSMINPFTEGETNSITQGE